MIDYEENEKQPPTKINLFNFKKYSKEIKISILANLILDELNYPIITETELEECISTYKLLDMNEKELKYCIHDIHVSDLTERDLIEIKDLATQNYVKGAETNTHKLLFSAFLAILHSKGYKVVKNE